MPETDENLTDLERLAVTTVADLERHPAHVYLASLAEGSRETMRRALDVIADIASQGNADRLTLDWAALRFQHTTAIRAALMEQYAPSTCNKMLSALRGVLKMAWRLELLAAEDYQRAIDLERVGGERLPPGRAITWGELTALMNACGPDPTGVRDAALIGCLYSGLRRAEVARLDLADQTDQALTVRGKRRKERRVPLMRGADIALADWLTIRGDWPGPLFVQIRKGGHVKSQRLTTRAINHILSERARIANIEEITPHDFRRSLIGDLLERGADIATVANLVGHSQVETTRRYDRRGEKAKQKAVGLLHLPYQRRVLREE